VCLNEKALLKHISMFKNAVIQGTLVEREKERESQAEKERQEGTEREKEKATKKIRSSFRG
jgi:hypothetical protein